MQLLRRRKSLTERFQKLLSNAAASLPTSTSPLNKNNHNNNNIDNNNEKKKSWKAEGEPSTFLCPSKMTQPTSGKVVVSASYSSRKIKVSSKPKIKKSSFSSLSINPSSSSSSSESKKIFGSVKNCSRSLFPVDELPVGLLQFLWEFTQNKLKTCGRTFSWNIRQCFLAWSFLSIMEQMASKGFMKDSVHQKPTIVINLRVVVFVKAVTFSDVSNIIRHQTLSEWNLADFLLSLYTFYSYVFIFVLICGLLVRRNLYDFQKQSLLLLVTATIMQIKGWGLHGGDVDYFEIHFPFFSKSCLAFSIIDIYRMAGMIRIVPFLFDGEFPPKHLMDELQENPPPSTENEILEIPKSTHHSD